MRKNPLVRRILYLCFIHTITHRGYLIRGLLNVTQTTSVLFKYYFWMPCTSSCYIIYTFYLNVQYIFTVVTGASLYNVHLRTFCFTNHQWKCQIYVSVYCDERNYANYGVNVWGSTVMFSCITHIGTPQSVEPFKFRYELSSGAVRWVEFVSLQVALLLLLFQLFRLFLFFVLFCFLLPNFEIITIIDLVFASFFAEYFRVVNQKIFSKYTD